MAYLISSSQCDRSPLYWKLQQHGTRELCDKCNVCAPATFAMGAAPILGLNGVCGFHSRRGQFWILLFV
jgi:hypothetical protein